MVTGANGIMSSNSKLNYNEAVLIESYFKSKSKHFYLNVMNNHVLETDERFQNMYIRKEHGYAHITVTCYAKQNAKFRDFEERKYYYITRLQDNDTLQIREDLIEKWASSNVSDLYVLVLDEHTNRVAEIAVKVLGRMNHIQKQSQNLNFLWVFTLAEDNLVWKKVNLIAKETEAKALMAQWQYLGNVVYSKYRENTFVKIISYDIKTGAKRNTVECKSIKQAYDLLEKRGFDLCYKTFQRKCRSEKPSLIKTDKLMFYVTDKVDFTGEDYINPSVTL